MWGKDVGGGTWYKYCVHMYVNGKMRSVETIPGMVGLGVKNDGWGEFNMMFDIF
jgi:transcription initiation factor IIF auxiliary subunit